MFYTALEANQYAIDAVGMDVNMTLAKSNRDPQRVNSTTFCKKELMNN
jgi:hypothetical protein